MKEESKYNLAARNILLNIKKKNSGPYWPRLLKDQGKYNWLNVDWTHYCEEDEEDEAAVPNWDGNNLNFEDMPNDEDDLEDSPEGNNNLDDLDQDA